MGHIFLYGPPGSGKTTLGSALAASLNLPFIDLDQAIQSKVGLPIARLMDECGEEGFRDVETEVLGEQVIGPEAVIALGGGTLLRPENRKVVEESGKVICLKAEPRILAERLEADPNQRPLLAGDRSQQLASLLERRADHYDSFPTQLNSDQTVERLFEQAQTSLGRFHLSAMGSYDVTVEDGSIGRLGELLRARSVKQPIVVTDENVCNLYSEEALCSLRQSGYEARRLVIPAGESSKSLGSVERLWHGFLEAGLDRGSTVIALGGGVVGDLAGFAASTFMRGIDWVCVPSTLLSMVDASIGGKTGFDLSEGKNLVGSFHAPRLVVVDPKLLSTLPEIEFRAGLAEVLKHGVIVDRRLFELCARGPAQVDENLPEIVRRAIAVKVRIIEADPYEKGVRAALNFGHTVGHAVELVSEFAVRHGEAVAIGMVAEARLAERLTIARAGLSQLIGTTLAGLNLPVRIPEELPRDRLIRAMSNDKKKVGGRVRFALPTDIGQMRTNIEVSDLQSVFKEESA